MSNSHGYALAELNLVSFDLAAPNTSLTSVPIAGLTAGETLVGIDFRPVNGLLYGLGVNAGADTATLYVISTRTGVAGAVGSIAGVGDLPAGNFGFDFNPSVDRVRVTTDTGLNFRLNPNSGAIAGVDTTIPAHDISGVAYTNNQPDNGNITTLYTLDALGDFLNIQNPPNGGTQIPVGPLGVDFSNVNGFDIPRGVNAPANNAVTTGSGFALLTVGGTDRSLQHQPASTAQPRSSARSSTASRPTGGFAIQNDLGRHSGRRALGRRHEPGPLRHLDARTTRRQRDQRDRRRRDAGRHRLSSADRRSSTASAVECRREHRHALSPPVGSGAATAVGVPGGIAFVSGGGAVDLPAGGYGMDFNPTVDRIRITTESGLNFRLESSAHRWTATPSRPAPIRTSGSTARRPARPPPPTPTASASSPAVRPRNTRSIPPATRCSSRTPRTSAR